MNIVSRDTNGVHKINLDNKKTDSKKSKILTVLFITVLMAFAAGVSLFFLSKQSLRLDEAQSLWQSARNPKAILNVIAQDVHLPLYHLILYSVQFIFGNGVFTARLLSLFFFLITIPAIYLLSKLALGRRVALFSTALFALSSFMNWYASEIRMYTLFALITVTSHYFFIRILKSPGTFAWVGYAVISMIGIYSHYFFTLTLLTQAVFFLINRKAFEKRSFIKFLTIAILIVIVFAPWLYFVYSLGAASNTKPLLLKPSSIDLFNVYSRFFFGFQTDGINTIILSLWPITVLFAFLGIRSTKRVPIEAMYFLFAAVLPVFLVFTFSLFVRPFFLFRYLIITLPPLFIFTAWLFSLYPKRIENLFRSLVIIGMIFALYLQIVSFKTPVKENYEEAVAYISQNIDPQDLLVVSAPFTIYPIEYYYKGSAPLTTMPYWDRKVSGGIPPFSEANMAAQVNEYKKSYREAWVLMSYDQGYEESVKKYFDNNFTRLEAKEFSPELNLYVYQLRYDQPIAKE